MTERGIYYIKGPPRLQHFLEAVAAATEHLNRAYETRSALECIVLSAVLIDAQLRVGVIMKDQLANGTDDVDESLLHQKDDDKKLSERAIIKMALERDLINEIGYRNLSDLYDQRNKCIHRYVISDINYDYVTGLVSRYAEALDKVREAVEYVESVQYARGIGLVKAKGDGTEPDFHAEFKKWMDELAEAKDKRPNHDG
jgi:hypothetical protein